MKIVITGSTGHISKPLTQELVRKGHSVKIVSSKIERKAQIEALGAKAAIGTMHDADFLSATFNGADVVYTMVAWDAIGSILNKDIDFAAGFKKLVRNYKYAVEQSDVKRIIHLSSVGAHSSRGNGSLSLYHEVENIMMELPDDVSIKFMRPVAFYTNTFRYIQTIKTAGAIVQSYGGDQKEPWVSPMDIASVIAEEVEKPFVGRTVRYIASQELSPNEIAQSLGAAIGKSELKWKVISKENLLNGMLAAGVNDWIANGFAEMQAAQRDGSLYEDYFKNRPDLGQTKLADFVPEFAIAYNQ